MEAWGDNVTALSFILLSRSGIECGIEKQDVYLDVLEEGHLLETQSTQCRQTVMRASTTELCGSVFS